MTAPWWWWTAPQGHQQRRGHFRDFCHQTPRGKMIFGRYDRTRRVAAANYVRRLESKARRGWPGKFSRASIMPDPNET